MNYLAHIFLSGTDPEVKIGNFIGDYVKGKQYLNYPENIQKGILLHRKIDSFTDSHPNVKESMKIFRPKYRKYAGVIVDVVYDHILAKNWHNYSDQSLRSYVNSIHILLIRRYFSLPHGVKQFVPYLIRSRRLENYKHLPGLRKTLYIMSTHTSLPDYSNWATNEVDKNFALLESQFSPFFEDLKEECDRFLSEKTHELL